MTLPQGAEAPEILQPKLDDDLASNEDDVTTVARITAAIVGSAGSTLVAAFEATGSDDVCTNPQNYPEGWGTVDVDLVVRFVQRVRTYVRGIGSQAARRRPARLNLDVVLRSLSWRTWDRRVARGRGLGPGGLPVSVRLSRPTNCGTLWRYLTARYRYTGAVPAGAPRSRTVRLDSTCR